MSEQPEGTAASPAGGAAKKGNAGRKRGPAGADQLAARLAGLGGQGTSGTTAARAPRTARGQAPAAARTGPARPAGRKTTTDTGRGARPVTASAPMAAEQKKAPAFYSSRISHATTPEQLGALEQLRLEENTRRRIAGLPTISLTSLLRAATQICLDSDKLRAQMVKDAVNDWNEKDRPSRR